MCAHNSGYGKLLVDRLADHARAAGIALLRLDTGIHQRAAIRLYERLGFLRTGPFGDYQEDPVSLYFEKKSESPNITSKKLAPTNSSTRRALGHQ